MMRTHVQHAAAAAAPALEAEKPASASRAGCGGLRPAVVLCVAVASTFSFLLGYDIGIMSGAKRLIKRDMSLSMPEVELLVGILNLVSGFGGLFAGRLADTLGRRKTAALASTLTAVGSLGMAFAPRYAPLLAGRVVTGLGVGGCFQIAPLYIAEIAPKRLRGALISSFDLSINVGILCGYVVGWALQPDAGVGEGAAGGADLSAWRWMLGLGVAPPVLILLGLSLMPESPRYLVARGQPRRAWLVLQSIYEPAEAEGTFEALEREAASRERLSLCEGARRVLLPAAGAPRAMMIAGLGAAFCQQITGVEAAVYYTPETLEAAGITDEGSLLLATVAVGCIKVLFILFAACLVESHGRVRCRRGACIHAGRSPAFTPAGALAFTPAGALASQAPPRLHRLDRRVARAHRPLLLGGKRRVARAAGSVLLYGRLLDRSGALLHDGRGGALPAQRARLRARRRHAGQQAHLGGHRPLLPLPLRRAHARRHVLRLRARRALRLRLRRHEDTRDQGSLAGGDRARDERAVSGRCAPRRRPRPVLELDARSH